MLLRLLISAKLPDGLNAPPLVNQREARSVQALKGIEAAIKPKGPKAPALY